MEAHLCAGCQDICLTKLNDQCGYFQNLLVRDYDSSIRAFPTRTERRDCTLLGKSLMGKVIGDKMLCLNG